MTICCYIAAGQIIPAVTGKTWEQYISERILQPLGMKTTTLSNAHFPVGSEFCLAAFKAWRATTARLISWSWINAAPAGSINSSVAEMARWMIVAA